MRKTYTHLRDDQLKNFSQYILTAETDESGRIYRTESGNAYPSITTVLGSIPNPGLDRWRAQVGEVEANRIMRHATIRGNAFHNAIEKYCLNEEEYFARGEMPHVKQMVRAIEPVLERIGIIAAQECGLYSDELQVAGRVDMIAEFDNIPSIIDFKTSSKKKTESMISNYFIQATAYSIMFKERAGIDIDQIVIIMAVEDDLDPLVFVSKPSKWKNELLKILKEYRNNL